MQISNINSEPGKDLFKLVKASFILNDDTLGKWCRRNAMNPSNVREAIYGAWNGPKGQEVRKQVVQASGLIIKKEEAIS